jgi:hypothetical protein
MELKNSAKIRDPDCASLRDHRAERLGSMGPRNVITIPVRAKSTWSRTVPVVMTGKVPVLGSEVEFMRYDECKSA